MYIRLLKDTPNFKKDAILKVECVRNIYGIIDKYITDNGYMFNVGDCKEATLLDLIKRNHTEITTRNGDEHIVVGSRMYDIKECSSYVEIDAYDEHLKVKYEDYDIMKIAYRDEVLWERKITGKTKLPFGECLSEWANNSDKCYIEVLTEDDDVYIYDKYINHGLPTRRKMGENTREFKPNDFLTGKWFLCDK